MLFLDKFCSQLLFKKLSLSSAVTAVALGCYCRHDKVGVNECFADYLPLSIYHVKFNCQCVVLKHHVSDDEYIKMMTDLNEETFNELIDKTSGLGASCVGDLTGVQLGDNLER